MSDEVHDAEIADELELTLHILRGRASRRSFHMKGKTLLIGSDGHCDIQMRSIEVAGKHCLISRRDGRATISQLDVDYAVTVDGEPVTDAALRSGAKIGLGPFEMEVSISGAAERSTPEHVAVPIASPTTHEENANRLDEELGARRQEIRQRFRELEERERAVQQCEQTLRRDRADLEDGLADLERRREIFVRHKRRFAQLRHRVLRRHRERLEESVRESTEETAERQNLLDEREAIVSTRESEIEDRVRELERQHDAIENDVSERSERLTKSEIELEQKRLRLERIEETSQKRMRRLRAMAAGLAERRRIAKSGASEERDRENELLRESLEDLRRSVLDHVEQSGRRNDEIRGWLRSTRDHLSGLADVPKLLAEEVRRTLAESQEPLRIETAFRNLSEQLEWLRRTIEEQETRLARENLVVSEGSGEERSLRLAAEPESANEAPRVLEVDDDALDPAEPLAVLKNGPIATTYLARLPDHAQPVILRVLASRWSRSEAMRSSFRIAVEPMIAFRHPNVATVHGLFDNGRRLGVVVEQVTGASLDELSGRSIPAGALMNYCRQTIAGVLAAHRLGFVHHSLRPSRLLVDPRGTVRILGYGEPSWLIEAHRCERGRRAAAYAAPEERTTGALVDARADLYSIGRIFLELATQVQQGPDAFPSSFHALLLRWIDENPGKRGSVGRSLEQLETMLAEFEGPTVWSELPSILTALASAQPRLRAA